MSQWPVTRMTLLERLRDPQNQHAWAEFVALYGPLLFRFARRRVPQDADAADVTQDVLGAVMRGTYQRPSGRFQKWLVTIVLNKIRDFHAARAHRCEVAGGPEIAERLKQEPSRSEVNEWDHDRQWHVFHLAAERVRARTNAAHWGVFERLVIQNEPASAVAEACQLSLMNVYTIKSRLLKEIKDEVALFTED